MIVFQKSGLGFEIYPIKVYKKWGTVLRKIRILNGLSYILWVTAKHRAVAYVDIFFLLYLQKLLCNRQIEQPGCGKFVTWIFGHSRKVRCYITITWASKIVNLTVGE